MKLLFGWKLTLVAAVLFLLAACLKAANADWDSAVMLVFTSVGWTGWAVEERKNGNERKGH